MEEVESPPTVGDVEAGCVVEDEEVVAALVALEDSVVEVLEVEVAETTCTVSGTEAATTTEVVGV